MGLPIGDIKEVFTSGAEANKKRQELIRVAIFVEKDAPQELVDLAKKELFPQTGTGLIHVSEFEQATKAEINQMTDLAFVISGQGEEALKLYKLLKKAEVPAALMGMQHDYLADLARSSNLMVPAEDIISAPGPKELTRRLAQWVIKNADGKELAFAANFPFVRRSYADKIVADTAKQNALVGGIVIIPGADMPVMTANQARMILQIASAYGQELGAARIKELVGVVGSAFALRAVARQVLTVVPALGWAVKAGIGYTGTLAMGKAVIEYFEQGGSVAGLGRKLKDSSQDILQKAKASAQEQAAQDGGALDKLKAGLSSLSEKGKKLKSK